MRIKKWVAVLLITIVFVGGLGGRVVLAAGVVDPQGHSQIYDALTSFPQEKIQKARARGYDVKFSKYEPSRYSLELYLDKTYFWEVDDTIANTGHYFLHGFNDIIWKALLTWDFTVIMVVENAFSLDIVDQFADAVEKAVQQLAGFDGSGYSHSGIVGNFLTFMIILAGAWMAYVGIIERKTTLALSSMVKSGLILILGLAFFANAGGVMRYLNDISSGLNEEVLGVGLVFQQELDQQTSHVQYPTEVTSMVVADKLYHMFIYEPYLILQYGKTSKDAKLTASRIENMLDHRVGSTARMQAVNEERVGNEALGIEPNVFVTTQGIFERLYLLLFLCFSHFILGLLFVLLAGAMLVYQFMFVLVALFAPFAFLLALNPAWSATVTTWFRRLIGYQLVKLMIGVFFTMLLTLSQFLYDMNPPEKVGYIWTIAMQLILVVGVVWKRSELFSILQAPVRRDERIQGNINIQVPLNYLTKYTEKFTKRVQNFRIGK
jgi:hypothetical protein